MAGLALSRETNFNRPGTLDVPLRQALSKAQRAAMDKNPAAYADAAREVTSRFNAIFYLSTARHIDEAMKLVKGGAGNYGSAAVNQAEALAYYRTIQPTVAKADPAVDRMLMEYFTAEPSTLTPERRDDVLNAFNNVFGALMLKPTDRAFP